MVVTTIPIIPSNKPDGQTKVAMMKKAAPAKLSNAWTTPEPSEFEAITSNKLWSRTNKTKPRIEVLRRRQNCREVFHGWTKVRTKAIAAR